MPKKTDDKFYWFDSGDSCICGPYSSEQAARAEIEGNFAGDEGNHKKTYTILKVVSTSVPPSMKRAWKQA